MRPSSPTPTMDFRLSHSIPGTAGWALLIALACAASAAPLPRDADGGARTDRRLSDADLALSDPRADLSPEAASTTSLQALGLESRRLSAADSQSFDFGQITSPSGGSVHDLARSYLTVRRASP